MTSRSKTPKRARELGWTDDDYFRVLDEQDGHCALCPTTPKTRRLHVDHDHFTGLVRGLLCYACNRRLDTRVTSEWCARAGAYLYRAELARAKVTT